jgi:DNA-binding LacI/PurR family transcriptional regulator
VAVLTRPQLTTVRQDREGLGRAAAQALVGLIEETGTVAPVTVLPVDLVVRGTTAAPPAADRRAVAG